MGGLRLSEWSLRALLILLVVDVFIIAPIAQDDTLPALRPVIHSIVLLSGIAIASRSRAPTMPVVGVLAVVGFVTHWIYHQHPTVPLGRADTALSLLFSVVITGVMLVQVIRAGPITWYRIEGAVTVYLLVAYSWALAYELVALSDPLAFSFPVAPPDPQNLRFRLLYFSTTTLTTVSYGDITPVNPVARSLAAPRERGRAALPRPSAHTPRIDGAALPAATRALRGARGRPWSEDTHASRADHGESPMSADAVAPRPV